MSGQAGAGARRFRPESAETRELRNALFDAFRRRRRYANLVEQDLRPLWRRAAQGADDNRLFSELRAFLELADGLTFVRFDPDAVAPLRAYVAAVERVVAETLRLTIDGLAPVWAGIQLHCDVEPGSGQGEPSPDVPHFSLPPRPRVAWFEQASLGIRVDPNEMTLALTGDDEAVLAIERVGGRSGYGHAQWSDLAARAHALLDRHLIEMRRSYEEHNRDGTGGDASAPGERFRFRNAAALRRYTADIEAIAGWLLGETVPHRAERERLRGRFRILGVDIPKSPTTRNKTAP